MAWISCSTNRPCASLRLFGTDYFTPDGTAIRGYLHVSDLAQAHRMALEYLLRCGATTALNLGAGTGHSVQEVIRETARITGRDIPVQPSPRREGDPPQLVAQVAKAQPALGFQCRHSDLGNIIQTAWQWIQAQKKS